jgi:hypothetical protein
LCFIIAVHKKTMSGVGFMRYFVIMACNILIEEFPVSYNSNVSDTVYFFCHIISL